MSTLARYKKRGGPKQLLYLLENSDKAKRDKLLDIVAKESEVWADFLEERLLTFEKFITWEPEMIDKVLGQLPSDSWVKSICGYESEQKQSLFERMTTFLSSGKKSVLQEDISEMTPSSGEIEAAQLLIIKKARELQEGGLIKPEEKDPLLKLQDLDNIIQ
ncbi:MAG: hypothetical protein KDD50_01340 [Bdellovibrionales bacterium]|nr:hypothetical protein [Bdellovibrionales bacterium]